jgi:MYXO-CTERM domain-containing protein
VQLDASGSVDIDGQVVSYAWSQQSGDTAVLSTPDSAQSRLALPLTAQMLEFELAVTDDAGGVATALVQVTVTEDAPRSGGGSSAIGLLTASLLLMLALTRVRRRRI